MLGLFVDSVPPEKAYQLAQAGHDWLCVDAAAEPLAAARLGELLGAIASGGSMSLVRVEAHDAHGSIQQALGLGANGIILPGITSGAEASRAVQACRSGGPAEMVVAVQVEDKQAIANIEEIAKTPGLDVLFLCPDSLSDSMGVADDPILGATVQSREHVLTTAVDALVQHARAQGKLLGVFLFGTARVEEFITQGFTFISIGNERRWFSGSRPETAAGSCQGDLADTQPDDGAHHAGAAALPVAGGEPQGAATAASFVDELTGMDILTLGEELDGLPDAEALQEAALEPLNTTAATAAAAVAFVESSVDPSQAGGGGGGGGGAQGRVEEEEGPDRRRVPSVALLGGMVSLSIINSILNPATGAGAGAATRRQLTDLSTWSSAPMLSELRLLGMGRIIHLGPLDVHTLALLLAGFALVAVVLQACMVYGVRPTFFVSAEVPPRSDGRGRARTRYYPTFPGAPTVGT